MAISWDGRAVRASGEVGVSGKGIYKGYALQQIDGKGRVAIPAFLRDTLIASNCRFDDKESASVILAMHESDPCLIGYDRDYDSRMLAELALRARAHAGEDGAPKSLILREALLCDTVPFDASGRFIMPPFYREELRLDRYAFFMGLGDYFEIWDPWQLVACDTAAPKMKSVVRFLMKEKGEVL